jgi:hypothetical protein
MCGCDLNAHTNLQETNTSQQAIEKTDLPSKKNIAGFVHSVTDMEMRVFTLNEAAKACREEAHKKENEVISKINNKKYELTKCERAYKEKVNSRNEVNSFRKYCRYRRSVGRIIGFLFMHYFLGALFTAPFAMGVSFMIEDATGSNGNPLTTVILVFVGIAIYFTAFTLIWALVKTKNYKKELRYRERNVLTAEEEVKKAQKAIYDAEQELENQKNDNLTLYNKAEELDFAASKIRENLKQCYELDIIPPSYRKFVCLIIINDIFVNDKADTMREAILLCDSEIRHGQLINKLDDIYHSLETLATNIQSIVDVVSGISNNIKKISYDISNMSNYQERIAYATESIQQSADNADFYIAQRRAGSI